MVFFQNQGERNDFFWLYAVLVLDTFFKKTLKCKDISALTNIRFSRRCWKEKTSIR